MALCLHIERNSQDFELEKKRKPLGPVKFIGGRRKRSKHSKKLEKVIHKRNNHLAETELRGKKKKKSMAIYTRLVSSRLNLKRLSIPKNSTKSFVIEIITRLKLEIRPKEEVHGQVYEVSVIKDNYFWWIDSETLRHVFKDRSLFILYESVED